MILKGLIEILCDLYFSIHKDTVGVILYTPGADYGFKISKENL